MRSQWDRALLSFACLSVMVHAPCEKDHRDKTNRNSGDGLRHYGDSDRKRN
jgi:hypothetical protein